jgi:hypothetical protein
MKPIEALVQASGSRAAGRKHGKGLRQIDELLAAATSRRGQHARSPKAIEVEQAAVRAQHRVGRA